MLPIDFITQLHALLPPERIYTDPVECYSYAYDNSRKIFPPEAVVFPLTIEEIQAITVLCNAHNIPLTPRGRGTGTSGGSLPEKGG